MQKKILILCPYSHPSACGIWKRVYNDALTLKNAGYIVTIFTSNIIKGTKQKSERYSNMNGIEVYRFPALIKLGGTAMVWLFFRKIIRINPDIIHAHGFRHPHSLFSLVLGKMLRKKVILTTHAPFKKDPRRSLFLKIMDITYDLMFGWWELLLYNKIIRISQWEEPFLKKRGIKNSMYIPNGIEKEFINFIPHEKKEPTNRIIFMGRLDPVKRVEWIVQAAENLPDKHFVIYGPLHGYSDNQIQTWKSLNNLEIITKTYHAQDFIEWVGHADIYILPSIRESLGITLLEAMALGVIPIASNTLGPSDIIEDNKNGFIVNSPRELIEKIIFIYSNWGIMKNISKQTRSRALEFDSQKLGKDLVAVYQSL